MKMSDISHYRGGKPDTPEIHPHPEKQEYCLYCGIRSFCDDKGPSDPWICHDGEF